MQLLYNVTRPSQWAIGLAIARAASNPTALLLVLSIAFIALPSHALQLSTRNCHTDKPGVDFLQATTITPNGDPGRESQKVRKSAVGL